VRAAGPFPPTNMHISFPLSHLNTPQHRNAAFALSLLASARLTPSLLTGPPTIGASYNGASPDADDSGTTVSAYLPNHHLDNNNASPPTTTTLGPVTYRTYTAPNFTCPSCGVRGDVATFYARPLRRFAPALTTPSLSNPASGGPWDTTLITLPNARHRILEAALPPSSPPLSLDTAVALPLLAAHGFRLLSRTLDPALRSLLLPVALRSLLDDAVAVYGASTGQGPAPSRAAVLAGILANATSAFPLALGVDLRASSSPAQPPPLLPAVLDALLDPAHPCSPLNDTAWEHVLGPAVRGEAPSSSSFPHAFASFFAPLDPSYLAASSPPSPTPKAAAHASVVLAWLARFVQPSGAHAAALARASASALFAAGLVSEDEWAAVLPAQLGANAVLGGLAGAGTVAGSASRTSVSVSNACPSSSVRASFADRVLAVPPSPSQEASWPPAGALVEASCWTMRRGEGAGGGSTGAGAFPPSSPPPLPAYGTSLESTRMRAFLARMTTGPALALPPAFLHDLADPLLPPNATFPLFSSPPPSPSPLLAGTAYLADFFAGVSRLAADLARRDPNATLHLDPVATALDNFQRGAGGTAADHAAAVAAAGPCPAVYDAAGTGLPCAVLADLASWATYVARVLVWEPLFVRSPPRVFNATAMAFGPHPDAATTYAAAAASSSSSSLRAGPFLRCTVREALEEGCHDNFLDYLGQLLVGTPPGSRWLRLAPAAPPTSEGAAGEAAWAARMARVGPDARRTGGGGGQDEVDALLVGRVDEIVQDAGETDVGDWGGPAAASSPSTTTTTRSPVRGSWSGRRFAPRADARGVSSTASLLTASSPLAPVEVWVPAARRPLALVFADATTLSASASTAAIDVWRYAAAWGSPSGSAFAATRADEPSTTPACAARVGAGGAPVFLAPPFFAGCGPNALRGGPVPGGASGANGSSEVVGGALSTFVEVEPLTGKAMRTRVRLGTHVLSSASPWFPNLTTTYALLAWTDVATDVSSEEARAFAAALSEVRARTGALLPEAFGGAGAALLAAGLFFVWLGRRTAGVPTKKAKAREVPGFRDREGEA
jgi:hypothetical protein